MKHQSVDTSRVQSPFIKQQTGHLTSQSWARNFKQYKVCGELEIVGCDMYSLIFNAQRGALPGVEKKVLKAYKPYVNRHQ